MVPLWNFRAGESVVVFLTENKELMFHRIESEHVEILLLSRSRESDIY